MKSRRPVVLGMRAISAILCAMLLIVSSTPGTTATAAEPTIGYDVVDLGTLGGNATFALDINDRGAVTGNSRTGATTLPLIAFRWKSGEMISLGVLPGSNAFSRGYAINNAGVIAGESDNNVPRAFRWKAGVLEDLGTLGGASAVAHGINNRGLIVGASSNGVAVRPFVWRRGVMRDLGTIEGSASTPGRAWDVNDRGDIVGNSRVTGSLTQATLWPGPNRHRLGTPVNLGSLGDGRQFSEALAVSNCLWVVGRSTVTGSTERAFRWTPDEGMLELGSLGFAHSRATDVNDRGEIVGYASRFAGFPTLGGAAFLWRGDQMWNLNDLIDPASGWELLAAEGINNRGMIVGYGRLRGEIRSFLLVPRGRSW
jgi:probable HAF family extracellular repeat protein